MNFKQLNENLQKFVICELSDNTKQNLIKGRQAQVDKLKSQLDIAQSKLNKSQKQIINSYKRQIEQYPETTDKQTSKNILEDLKYEMKRIDSGSDWRLEEEDNSYILEVRYWGDWEGDDGSGDYDWQTLTSEYRTKLEKILMNVQKQYKIRIEEINSEKNWLSFRVSFDKLTPESILPIDIEQSLLNGLKTLEGKILEQKEVQDGYLIKIQIKMYEEEQITDKEIDLFINSTFENYSISTEENSLSFSSIKEVLDYLTKQKQEAKEKAEEIKKQRILPKKYRNWLYRKIISEPMIKKFAAPDLNTVILILKDGRKASLKKIQKRKSNILQVQIENEKPITQKLEDNQLDFESWIELGFNFINNINESRKHKLKRQSFIQALKEQDIDEKLVSNRRFRKNKKSEVDRIE